MNWYDSSDKHLFLDTDNEAAAAFRCEFCNENIYIGYFYYDVDGKKICQDCICDMKKIAEREQ